MRYIQHISLKSSFKIEENFHKRLKYNGERYFLTQKIHEHYRTLLLLCMCADEEEFLLVIKNEKSAYEFCAYTYKSFVSINPSELL